MNRGHAELSDWGMQFLHGDFDKILDIGCGGGRNLLVMGRNYPDATLTGIDHSRLAVDKAKSVNRRAIVMERTEIMEGDVSHLPFEDGTYALATAFETVYFWPELEACFSEVHRVLQPGGTFLIVQESNGLDDNAHKWEDIIEGLKAYTAEEITTAIEHAAFTDVQVFERQDQPWIAVRATK